MMGGRDTVFAAAERAVHAEDHQWVAELVTHLIRINKEDWDARNLKAEALRQIGNTRSNISWRNWYLTSAAELDGTIDYSRQIDLAAPDMARAFPTANLIDSFRYRLDAERTLDVDMTMVFRFPDTDESFGLEIRRGIVQVTAAMLVTADVVLEISRSTLMGVLLGELDLGGRTGMKMDAPGAVMAALFKLGKAKLTTGSAEHLARFFSYFDEPSDEPIMLTLK